MTRGGQARKPNRPDHLDRTKESYLIPSFQDGGSAKMDPRAPARRISGLFRRCDLCQALWLLGTERQQHSTTLAARSAHATDGVWLRGYGFSVVRYSTKSTNSWRDIACCRPDGIIDNFCVSPFTISAFLKCAT